MNEITVILSAIEQGDPNAAERLLALVYAELRRLAAHSLTHERPGQTLDPTALVHETYLRLFGEGAKPHWENRRHFFGSAAEAMRRILIEIARRKKRERDGRDRLQVEFAIGDLRDVDDLAGEQLLALHEALVQLAAEDPTAAELVKLRFFAGLSIEQAGEILGFPRATAYRNWNYVKAWLRCEIQRSKSSTGN